MKKLFIILTMALALSLTFMGCKKEDEVRDEKPVIYLYPEEKMELEVQLDYVGELLSSYPKYEKKWVVTAYPDGKLETEDGREFYSLFWEGKAKEDYKIDEGFLVKGEDSEKFLEEKLEYLGLNYKERNEFIIYWLPRMENNKYNLIKFLGDEYTEKAKLSVEPEPDSMIRVFMVFQGVDKEERIPLQKLEKAKREGFTLVEWGGREIK